MQLYRGGIFDPEVLHIVLCVMLRSLNYSAMLEIDFVLFIGGLLPFGAVGLRFSSIDLSSATVLALRVQLFGR